MTAPDPSTNDPAPATEPEAGPEPMSRFRRLYGAGPWNLLGHAIVIGIAAYALSIMFRAPFAPRPLNLVCWLLGGAIIHDLVFLPAYSAVNVAATKLVFKGSTSINYLRVPVILSGILFLAFLPRITNRQPQNFERALGHAPPDYLSRWLLVTALLFAAAGVIWSVRRLRGRGVTEPHAIDA